jgi:phosphotransacetylase
MLPASLRIVDVAAAARDPRITKTIAASSAGRLRPADDVQRLASDPLYVTAALLALRDVGAAVAGASRPTADVLRADLRVVGLAPGVRTVSSCFLMLLADGRRVAYGDCAVLPDPTEPQLADVAVATAGTYRDLVSDEPAVAMLSFSTQGSASHPNIDKVRRATRLVRERLPVVGSRKAPGSAVAGRANVLLFPNLDAGNIAYKVTERVGSALGA